MESKEFKTCDVMSTITGRLMGDIGGVYEVLNWMTGESVYTHQIPRISKEAVPVILAVHPHFELAIGEAENVNQENFAEWRDTWDERYGATIAVPKFTVDTHERIDPMSELAEKVHPSQMVVAVAT